MFKKKEKEIDITKTEMPRHVAIIMDGNGRWAKKKGMIRSFGHQSAIKSVRDSIEFCQDMKIPYLTLYAFSSENWNRPTFEVNALMSLLVNTIKKETKTLIEKGVRIKVIGNITKLPKDVYNELESLIRITENLQNGTLILALSYGAKEEIIEATKKIALDFASNKITEDQINEDLFSSYLYTKDIPDVDLLIRTSGECRISNFLLWQIAYSELYFTDVLWPDFNKGDFLEAIKYYATRERRFGKTSEQLKVK
ncbi:isoprenyl transferase [Apibacter muscae]|uniref:Isoprenyl transferase n=1 Tax=Apibacter muscae TaxID=2509004 RepID=A0A563DEM2_9FLAO|nr:isoprenyl transferase [Apibacter muscae]TWP24437.1 isoprenyl transferase [Apibacter muscae]TWP28748.1 isoprenyl transferase [Apibacter muscae]TWP30000.1 isoprenyl transferase [Apibacter muscae]